MLFLVGKLDTFVPRLEQAVVLIAQRGAQLGHRQRRATVRLRHLPLLVARRQRQRVLRAGCRV